MKIMNQKKISTIWNKRKPISGMIYVGRNCGGEKKEKKKHGTTQHKTKQHNTTYDKQLGICKWKGVNKNRSYCICSKEKMRCLKSNPNQLNMLYIYICL